MSIEEKVEKIKEEIKSQCVKEGYIKEADEEEKSMLEKLAEIEHEQWMTWATALQDEVSPERKYKWKKVMIPYKDLTEEDKEKDREWARKIMEVVNKQNS
jgi:hypothetical protein